MKVGKGSNVTVPFAFAVYVPCPATVTDVKVQELFGVVVVAQSLTVDPTRVAGAVTVSFVNTEIV